MRVLAQRVSRAQVTVDGKVTGRIAGGLLLLVGIGKNDDERELEWMAGKVLRLRVFPDEEGKMNRSVQESGGGLLVVSQFTLYGDCRKGNRPSFASGAPPTDAERLYLRFVEMLRADSGLDVQTGVFAAHMEVELVNDGPVTLWIESPVERQ